MSLVFTQKEEPEEEGDCHKCEVCDFRNCTYQTEIDKVLGIYPYRENEDGLTDDDLPPEDTEIPQPAQPPVAPLEILQPLALENPSDPPQPEPPDQAPRSESTPVIVKRRRGAPKGNLNALKHGLYVEGRYIRNATPIERAQLADFHSIITHFKTYMDSTYEQGMKAKTLAEYNDTLRTLSMGLIALARAVTLQNAFITTPLPANISSHVNVTTQDLVEYYQKKLDAFMQAAPTDAAQTDGP